jgi:hypothetical protein
LFFLSSNFLQSQVRDTIKLEEVFIKSHKVDYKKILKNLKNQLLNNIDSTSTNYILMRNCVNNDKTIIDEKKSTSLKIIDFANHYFFKSNDTIKSLDFNKYFSNYSEEENPLKWVINYPIYKVFNITDLDFFRSKKYKYILNKGNKEDVLEFYSDDEYIGKVQYNKENYNILLLEFKNVKPYPFYHKKNQNLKVVSNFESNWIYKVEQVKIRFRLKNNKLKLAYLELEEEIEKFIFKRYDKSGNTIFKDSNNFQTKIIIYEEN